MKTTDDKKSVAEGKLAAKQMLEKMKKTGKPSSKAGTPRNKRVRVTKKKKPKAKAAETDYNGVYGDYNDGAYDDDDTFMYQ